MRALLALLMATVLCAGCDSYSQIEPVEVANHEKVRVTMTDGERQEVRDARFESDTIRGEFKGDEGWTEGALPVDSLTLVEGGRVSAAKTIPAVIGFAALTAVTVAFWVGFIGFLSAE